MKRITYSLLAVGLIVLAGASETFAGRGRGGGGGGRGGGGGSRGGGGFTAPARPQPQAASRSAASRSGVGPGGGTVQSGHGSGSVTTKGGSTIEFKGGAAGGTTGGGVSGGKSVGGVKVTGPGGQTAGKVSKGGAATGPGGVTVGSKGSVGGTTGPRGSAAGASRGGIAVGQSGAVAGRTGLAATPRGTYYRSAAAISGQGARVRTACAPYYGCFTKSWVARYPGAWFAAGWVAGSAWSAASWGAVSASAGYPAESTSYDYGGSVVYQDDGVYVDGESVGTPEEYAQQASTIADTGKEAKTGKDDEWLPLGVFAMVQGEETTSNNIFQLAINKDGVIRGNYYNALTDSTLPVFGSADKKTQRAAWTVGEKKTPVYEAGILNLTKNDSTMMVHYEKGRSQQFTLFRIEQPKEGEEKK
jgi:hypothetical protein